MAEPISILGWNVAPDTSGEVFFENYTVKATNDTWKHLVGVFNDSTTRDGMYGLFRVPASYSTSSTKADIVVEWTATATSGDVEWDFDYRAVGGDDSESLDSTAGVQQSLNINDTAPTAANEKMTATLSMTTTNLAAGDLVEFGLFRDGSDAGDGMAAAAMVHGAYFDYST